MCETRILVNGKEHTKEAAKIEVRGNIITIYDLLGGRKNIKNAEIEEIDFLGHTTKLRKKK
jgi:predicted RNA-binding protein